MGYVLVAVAVFITMLGPTLSLISVFKHGRAGSHSPYQGMDIDSIAPVAWQDWSDCGH